MCLGENAKYKFPRFEDFISDNWLLHGASQKNF